MIVVFVDRTQLLLLPTFGVINRADGLYFTLSFLFYGISFRIAKPTPDE